MKLVTLWPNLETFPFQRNRGNASYDLRENYSPALFLCQGFNRFYLLCGFPCLLSKGEDEDDKADDDNTEQANGAVKQDCCCRQRLAGSQC